MTKIADIGWTPLRRNLLEALKDESITTDDELKAKLARVIDAEVERECNSKSRMKRVIMMKKLH